MTEGMHAGTWQTQMLTESNLKYKQFLVQSKIILKLTDLCFWTESCYSKKVLPEWKTKMYYHHSKVFCETGGKIPPFQ